MTLKSTFRLTWISIFILLLMGSCVKDLTDKNENADHIVKLYGGSSFDTGNGISTTPDGGFAITGTMKTTAYLNQAVLILTDKFGNNITGSPFYLEDTTSTYGNHLLVTSDGGYLITGSIIKKYTGANNYDVMVAKLKADGSLAWLRMFGGNDDDEGYCATELNDGSFLIGGYTTSYGNGKKDAFVLKLNSNGNLIKQLTYGGTEDDECRNIMAIGNDFLILGSTKSFQYQTQSIFLVKIDENGGITDNVQFGGTYNFTGIKSLMELNGDIDIISNYSDVSSAVSGIYVLKLNSSDLHTPINFKFIDNQIIQKKGNDILLYNDNLIILGSYTSNSNADFSIVKINPSFTTISELTIKSGGNQTATSGIITPDGKLAFTGSNIIGQNSKIALLKMDLPN